jgi:hypothetical protein
VKRKAVIATAGFALLFAGVWLFRVSRANNLPRIPLAGGGEFRIVKICYGGEDDHRLGGAPKQILWLWNHFPAPVQRMIPEPLWGDSSISPYSGHVALSIFWTWIDPVTQEATIGPSGDVLMTTDSGEQINLGWPHGFTAQAGGNYRQIFVDAPPRNSSKLRFRVPVEDETVEFTIVNPAYAK